MNIICFGDSITQGSNFCEGDKWPTILQHKLDALRPGEFKVYNRGIGGNTTSQALRRIKEDVLPLLPGMVLVEFGINDRGHKDWIQDLWVSLAEFKRNMALIDAITKRERGHCVFLVNHPLRSEPKWPVNDDLSRDPSAEHPFDTAIRDVAANCKSPLIDLPKLLHARKIRVENLLSADGCHLCPEGNHHYAAAVLEGIVPLLKSF